MKHKILLPAIVVSLTISGIIAATFIARKIEQPIFIETAEELNNIRNNLSGHYVVKKDISIKSLEKDPSFDGWVPIGTKEKPFTGTIDFRHFSIKDLYYSSSYIERQFKDDAIENVIVGFLGYSKGSILNGNFYKPINPEFDTTLGNKPIVCGHICAVNEGIINNNKLSYVNESGDLKGSNITFGSLVGVNKKEVSIAKSTNTFSAVIGGESSIGGVIGLSTESSINKFLYKGGYFNVTFSPSQEKQNVNFGGLIGTAIGGNFSNCYLGSNANDEKEYSFICNGDNTDKHTYNIGGLIGYVGDKDNINIDSSYIDTHFSVRFNSDSMNVASLIGKSDNDKLTIKNVLINSYFNIKKQDANNSVLCNENVGECSNNIYTDKVKSDISLNIDHNVEKKDIADITCKSMKWDTKSDKVKWIKNGNRFYLDILW